jgi:hypothetical protein
MSFTKSSRKEVRLSMFIVSYQMTELVLLRLESKCPALKTVLLLCNTQMFMVFTAMANIMTSQMHFSSYTLAICRVHVDVDVVLGNSKLHRLNIQREYLLTHDPAFSKIKAPCTTSVEQ